MIVWILGFGLRPIRKAGESCLVARSMRAAIALGPEIAVEGAPAQRAGAAPVTEPLPATLT